MTITIKYFGVIAEEAGKNEEVLDLDSENLDLESLKDRCFSKYSQVWELWD